MYVVLTRLGGAAAIVGGSLWVVKGGGILLTGEQLPLVFEVALPLFCVGLLGLRGRLGNLLGPAGRAGVLVAYASAAAAVAALAFPLAPFLAVAGFGPFFGLILLGGDVLRTRNLPTPWRFLPTAMGLTGPVLIVGAGAALALIDVRLLEVPIMLVGLAWVLLGYAILKVEGAEVQRSATVWRTAGSR